MNFFCLILFWYHARVKEVNFSIFLSCQVISVVNRRSGVQKISFVAHSLGGLIARYAIGKLYEPVIKNATINGHHVNEDKYLEGRIAGLEPMNFITFATPHLGSRGHKQVLLDALILMYSFILMEFSIFKCKMCLGWKHQKFRMWHIFVKFCIGRIRFFLTRRSSVS